MKKVLVIEDDAHQAGTLKAILKARMDFECDMADSVKSAHQKLKKNGYFMAVLDLDLPGLQEEETLGLLDSKGISVIVYAAEFNDEVRERMIERQVLDYVVKKDDQALDYIVDTIARVHKNQSIKVMVADDSRISRSQITRSLETQKFIVLEASNGEEALNLLKRNPDTMLIITDYKMPRMDGFELIAQVRKEYATDRLAIIGISAYGSSLISIQFLKRGANDFITKPFLVEELYLRVKQNIEMLEHIDAFQKLSNLDFLTQLYNRRFFFEIGNKIFENAKRRNLELTTALLDLDRFKNVNDTYGHEAGDKALKHVADLLARNFRSGDVVARYGGEEFAILAINMDRKQTDKVFNRIRTLIKSQKMEVDGKKIELKVSIGVTTRIFDTLEETIKRADELLYKAKRDRDTVVCD
ncbi:MAG: diguanylate cyclase [Candidatus Aminicenantaceae bacterium]